MLMSRPCRYTMEGSIKLLYVYTEANFYAVRVNETKVAQDRP